MKKFLIITGGNIKEEIIKKTLKNNNFETVIAVDKGLEILEKLQIKPNHIIGDFDSINNTILEKYQKESLQIHRLNPEKDFTDTHMAIKLAENLGAKDITILGAIGTRMDHTIANIHILKELLDMNINTKIINENNEIELIKTNTEIIKDTNYKYVSIIPLTTTVTGITLKGMKYCLENATLSIGQSIGVSNEQIENIAYIEFKTGILILIKSKD